MAGLSLREVERRTEVSNAYLSQLENGTAAKPSPHILYQLAGAYGVPYVSLMEAAGYLEAQGTERVNGTEKRAKPKRVSALSAALMSARLSEEQEAKVAEYIEFLRNTRRS